MKSDFLLYYMDINLPTAVTLTVELSPVPTVFIGTQV